MIAPLCVVALLAFQQPSDAFEERKLATVPEGCELKQDARADGEIVIGVPPEDRAILFSPDLRRAAFVVKSGEKEFAVVDGVPGKKFEEVNALQFSNDGKRVGYVGAEKEGRKVVVDGRETGPYETPELCFGPGGRYVINDFVRGKGSVLTVEGQQRQELGGFCTLKFSPDRSRMACIVRNAEETQAFAIIDGKKSPVFAAVEWLEFSGDGRRVGYVGKGLTGDTVVVDGIERRNLEGASLLGFSPDGKRVAYALRKNGWRICVDGKEGAVAYDQVWDITFSPDSKRVAYAARKEGKWLVVVDEEPGPLFDKADWPRFSPDSRKVAYRAKAEGKSFVVVDGAKEAVEFDEVGGPEFSSDSAHYHYRARARGQAIACVIDGKPGGGDEDVRFHAIVTADRRHVIRCKGQCIVIDGKISEPYEQLGPILLSPDGKRVAYGVRKGREVWRKVSILE